MDLYGYIDQVENAFDDRARLHLIQSEATADPDLIGGDRALVIDRCLSYLADIERENNDPDDQGRDVWNLTEETSGARDE